MSINNKNNGIISIGSKDIGPYYWVGHCDNGIDYYAGQTFKATANGVLKRIKLFSSLVYGQTNATLMVYKFDEANHVWQQKLVEAKTTVTKAMEGNWINFDLPPMEVSKDGMYGFKLSCNNGGMMAVAECPWNVTNPYPDGEEWIATSQTKNGNFHKDFDLAFQAEILA
jgi:hypothetical protein